MLCLKLFPHHILHLRILTLFCSFNSVDYILTFYSGCYDINRWNFKIQKLHTITLHYYPCILLSICICLDLLLDSSKCVDSIITF